MQLGWFSFWLEGVSSFPQNLRPSFGMENIHSEQLQSIFNHHTIFITSSRFKLQKKPLQENFLRYHFRVSNSPSATSAITWVKQMPTTKILRHTYKAFGQNQHTGPRFWCQNWDEGNRSSNTTVHNNDVILSNSSITWKACFFNL